MRIGFLGAGLIATHHSKMLRAVQGEFTRAGVFDIDPIRTEAFASRSGHAVCSSEDELLDTCDAVYICTWTSEHRRLVEKAASRQMAVFCEKPLATTLEDAEAMLEAVDRAGVPAQSGLILRHSPVWALVQELLADPVAGKLITIVFRDDQYLPTQGTYASTWRGDASKAGAGTLIEHSIHDIDLLLRLGGEIDTVSATTRFNHGLEGIEDLAVCMFGFDSGAVATLTSVWHDNLSRRSQRHVELICERRHITVAGDDFFGPVTWQDADGTERSLRTDELISQTAPLLPDGYNPDAAFVRALIGSTQPTPGFAEAVAAQRVVDACYQSAALNS